MHLHGHAVRIHDQELQLVSDRLFSVDGLRERARGGSRQRPGQSVQSVRAVSVGGVGLDLDGGFGDVDPGGAAGA